MNPQQTFVCPLHGAIPVNQVGRDELEAHYHIGCGAEVTRKAEAA